MSAWFKTLWSINFVMSKKNRQKEKTKNVTEVLCFFVFCFLSNIIIQQDDMSSHISQPQRFLFSTVSALQILQWFKCIGVFKKKRVQ